MDIYPNGGDNHPGCSAQDLKVPPGRLAARLGSRCNHMRSVEIEFTDFGKNQSHCHPIAYACDDYSSFMAGLCSDCGEENENCVLMGFKKDPVLIDKASKSYFIKTGDSENLCRKKEAKGENCLTNFSLQFTTTWLKWWSSQSQQSLGHI